MKFSVERLGAQPVFCTTVGITDGSLRSIEGSGIAYLNLSLELRK
jgi:hypothetical protein